MGAVNEVSGVAVANISEVSGIANNAIAEVSGINFSQASNLSITWNFDDQTVATSTSATNPGWVPSLTHSSWANGSAAVDNANGYWSGAPGTPATNTNPSPGKASYGWRCDSNATSSASTGPLGALNAALNGTHDTGASTKYIFSETSGTLGTNLNVCRTPGFTPRTDMADFTNNDLKLKFWLHAFGDSVDYLRVYVDDAQSSNTSNALEYVKFLGSYSGTSAGTGTYTMTASAGNHTTVSPTTLTYSNGLSSLWIQVEISLNNLRGLNVPQYIYFVAAAKPGIANQRFRGDIAIDHVQIIEE